MSAVQTPKYLLSSQSARFSDRCYGSYVKIKEKLKCCLPSKNLESLVVKKLHLGRSEYSEVLWTRRKKLARMNYKKTYFLKEGSLGLYTEDEPRSSRMEDWRKETSSSHRKGMT